MISFKDRLAVKKTILLDGGLGTELERRGFTCPAPIWSASALLDKKGQNALREIHVEFLKAGAEVISACSWRTNIRALDKAGLSGKSKALTELAVSLAREARDQAGIENVWIAGSIGPVEDCYEPELVPPDQELRDEHRRHIDSIYSAGADIIFLETMNTFREAKIVAEYAVQTGLPVLVSFVCKDEEHILSGEAIEDVIEKMNKLNVSGMLVNCIRPEIIPNLLEIMKSVSKAPIGTYANILPDKKFTNKISDNEYADIVQQWIQKFDLKFVGGCCGATPKHIEKMKGFLS